MDFTLLLDFDHTVLDGSSWGIFHELYDTDLPDFLEKYSQGEVTMEAWCKRDLAAILTSFQPEDLDKVLDSLEVRNGFEEFVEEYSPRFQHMGIVSGGFPPLIKRFAREYGMSAHVVEYDFDGQQAHVRKLMCGPDKKQVIQKFARDSHVIYVADDLVENYELSDYGERVLRVHMGPGGEHSVSDFHELGKLVEKVIADPPRYF